MATPRRTRAQSKNETVEDEQPEEMVVEKSSSKKTPKSRRKSKRNEELKSKNTGVGLKISLDSPNVSKKIVFDEKNLPDVEDEEEQDEAVVEKSDDDDDDDDDDAVEEVQGQAARDEVLEQLKSEEKGALKTKKKKKRKERKEKKVEAAEDDFDDDFFDQLDSVRAQEAKEKEAEERPKGSHTTFVFQQEEAIADSKPRSVDHNIQVVVLKNPSEETTANAITAVPTNALSDEALLYSRNRLVDGKDARSGKKRGRQEEDTWKRSRKMNHLVSGRARINRRGGRGAAAANFAKKREPASS